LGIAAWVRLWSECHDFVQGAPVRNGWPDGGATLAQPAVTVTMFRLIRDEYGKELEAQEQRDIR
jgi:hypothetical protein